METAVLGAPSVRLGKVSDDGGQAAALRGQTGMLHLLTGGTERRKPLDPLDRPVVVVVPDFVAFDRPAPTSPAVDLAAVTRVGSHLTA